MCGNFVETAKEPQWKTVEEYRKYLKKQAPNPQLGHTLFEPDIQCTCCTQEAPAEAAAMLKVEDETPFTKKFGLQDISPTGKQGEVVWICADCYTNGVRPKYIYFGDIKWNKYGRKIKNRAEDRGKDPW